jgi:hypothetical protein
MPPSKAQQALTAERRAKLLQLRLAGISFHDERILALGYESRGHASKDLIRALKQHRADEAAAVDVYRQQENERLDGELSRLETLEAAAHKVLSNHHIVVNNGRVILHPDTDQPMEDDAPVLQAIDRLIKIEDARRRNGERRAKLNGLDMPVQTELSGPGGGGVPIGPVGIAELRNLIQTAGDPDDPADSIEEQDEDADDDRDNA